MGTRFALPPTPNVTTQRFASVEQSIICEECTRSGLLGFFPFSRWPLAWHCCRTRRRRLRATVAHESIATYMVPLMSWAMPTPPTTTTGPHGDHAARRRTRIPTGNCDGTHSWTGMFLAVYGATHSPDNTTVVTRTLNQVHMDHTAPRATQQDHMGSIPYPAGWADSTHSHRGASAAQARS